MTSPISSISPTPFSPPLSPATPSTSASAVRVPLLEKLTGPQGELFKRLYKNGFVDAFGDFLHPDDSVPFLGKEGLKTLIEALFSSFSLLPNFKEAKILLPDLITAFAQRLRKDFSISKHILLGSYLYHLMGKDPDFLKSLAALLKVDEDLLKEIFLNLFSYSDIDIQSILETPYPLSRSEFEEIKNLALQIESSLLDSDSPEIIKMLNESGLQKFKSVPLGFLQLFIITFQNTSLEWSISRTAQAHGFTVDNLYLPIDDLLLQKENVSITFQTRQSNSSPLRNIAHFLLGLLKVTDISSLNHKAWLRLTTCLVRGMTSGQVGLEETLFSRLRGDLKTLVSEWIDKHHKDPLSAFTFLYHLTALGRGRIESQEMKSLWSHAWEPERLLKEEKSAENALFIAMASTAGQNGERWPLLHSLLQVAAFFSPSQPFVTVSVTHHEFSSLLLKLKIRGNNFLLESEPAKALLLLQEFHDLNPKIWEQIQPRLEHLLFLLVGSGQPIYHLEIDVGSLKKVAETLLESDKPFIQYLAFLCLMIPPDIEKTQKQKWAMTYCPFILCGIQNDELRMVAAGLIEQVMDKPCALKSFANLSLPQFTSAWIEYLFTNHKPEIAYLLWTKKVDKDADSFTFQLIPKLCPIHITYARAMLASLKKSEILFAHPLSAVTTMTASIKRLQTPENKSLEVMLQAEFFKDCQDLYLLLLEKAALPIKEKKRILLSQGILWFALRNIEKNESSYCCTLIDAALEKKLLPEGSIERKKGIELLASVLEKQDVHYVFNTVKRDLFSLEQKIFFLLNYTPNLPSKEKQEGFLMLLEVLSQCTGLSEDLLSKSLELILDILESIPLFPISFLYSKKAKVENLLTKLMTDRRSPLLMQRVLRQITSKDLNFSKDEKTGDLCAEILNSYPLTSSEEWGVVYKSLSIAEKNGLLNHPQPQGKFALISFQLLDTSFKLQGCCSLETQVKLVTFSIKLQLSEKYLGTLLNHVKEIFFQLAKEKNDTLAIAFLERLSLEQYKNSSQTFDTFLAFLNGLIQPASVILFAKWVLASHLFQAERLDTYGKTSSEELSFLFSSAAKHMLKRVQDSKEPKSLIPFLSKFIQTYTGYINQCTPVFWYDFFDYSIEQAPKECLPLYFKCLNAFLFDDDPYLRQFLFVTLLQYSLANDCLELISFFESPGILKQVFAFPTNLLLQNQTETILLCAVFSSLSCLPHDRQESLFFSAKERFLRGKCDRPKLSALDEESKKIIEKNWVRTELLYILALLDRGEKVQAKSHLEWLQEHAFFQLSWGETASLINTLASPAFPEFEEIFLSLLERRTAILVPFLDYNKIIGFLSSHPNFSLKIRGSQLLREDLLIGLLTSNPKAIALFKSALTPLWNSEQEVAKDEIQKYYALLVCLNYKVLLNWKADFACDLFLYFLPILSTRKETNTLELTYKLLSEFMEMFDTLWPQLLEKKMLPDFFPAIASITRMSVDKELTLFNYWVNRIWSLLDQATQPNARYPLSKAEAYRLKAQLTQEMMCMFVEDDLPFPQLLAQMLSKFVSKLMLMPKAYQNLPQSSFDLLLSALSSGEFDQKRISINIEKVPKTSAE